MAGSGDNSAGGNFDTGHSGSLAGLQPPLHDHAEDRTNSTEYTANNNPGMAKLNPSGGDPTSDTFNAYLHYSAGSPKNSAGA